jgi:hypothetical protein
VSSTSASDLFCRPAGPPPIAAGVGAFEAAPRPELVHLAEDLRRDCRVSPQRAQALAARYPGAAAADAAEAKAHFDSAIGAQLRPPAGTVPAFVDPALNGGNLVPTRGPTRLGPIGFLQYLPISRLLAGPHFRTALSATARGCLYRMRRSRADRGAIGRTQEEIWVAALDDLRRDGAAFDRFMDKVMALISRYKSVWHPTWVAMAQPDLLPPAAPEAVMARLGVNPGDAYLALLRYTGDEILGVADRAAIPTVLDGVTPGLFHRAPPDAQFTNPRYHGRARRPASIRRIAPQPLPRSGFAVDLRRRVPPGETPALEFVVEDVPERFAMVWRRAGSGIVRTHQRQLAGLVFWASPSPGVPDYAAMRQRHRDRVWTHIA